MRDISPVWYTDSYYTSPVYRFLSNGVHLARKYRMYVVKNKINRGGRFLVSPSTDALQTGASTSTPLRPRKSDQNIDNFGATNRLRAA